MAGQEFEERCRAAMSGLRRLTDDLEWYKETYDSAFTKISHKDKVLQHVTDKFDSEVLEKFKSSLSADREFNVLGIGVGEGPHEFHFVKTLSAHFKRINIYAVEPCQSALEQFRRRLESDDVTKMVTCHWFPTTLAQFLTEQADLKEAPKFNLVSAIHSLYHTADLKAAVGQLLSMVDRDGVILCELMSDSNVYLQFLEVLEPWLQSSTLPHLPKDIMRICEEKGNDVTIHRMFLASDVTEIFDESCKYGNKLLDFFTMTTHFRRLAPSAVVSYVIEFWRSRTVEGDNGRKLVNADEELIMIQKK